MCLESEREHNLDAEDFDAFRRRVLAIGEPGYRIERGRSAPTVQVTANPAGLAAGDYYGQVQISSTGIRIRRRQYPLC